MLHVGAASRTTNNTLGSRIQGATTNRTARRIRDDLEADGLFLRNGRQAVLLVSCEVGGLEAQHVTACREAMAEAAGLCPRDILIAATHTTGPSVIPTCYGKDVDHAYLDRLRGWLVELAREAVATARPARIGWGVGAAHIGYNRRCCWANGTHSMHGDTSRADFTGLEGPDDPQHLALFAVDAHGKPIAVLHHNTAHPKCFYGADFYSADFPGEARRLVREQLGPIPVVFFNGAIGDIGLVNLLARRRENAEQKLHRVGAMVANETLRLFGKAEFHSDVPLAHVWEDLRISVRLPTPERLARARRTLGRVDAGKRVGAFDIVFAHGSVLLQDTFGDDPVDVIPVHTVRIGDVALVTQPTELYCQFGLDIKRRSPAPHTAVNSITDGFCGYCPTLTGIQGGGYSADTIYWTRLDPTAGPQVVDTASRLLRELWR